MVIKDTRIDKEAKKDKRAQELADKIIFYIPLVDASNKPGAWIKKFGRNKDLSILKSKHFNHRIK